MATKTSNYEFNKPEQNDFYDVDVQNENWDKLDKELSEFDDSGATEDIKSFPDFLTKFVTGNKVAVTLRNLKAGLQFVLHTGQIVNNCVTDNAGLPLSAAQGKVLKDLYTQLYSDLNTTNNNLSKKADATSLSSYALKSDLTAYSTKAQLESTFINLTNKRYVKITAAENYSNYGIIFAVTSHGILCVYSENGNFTTLFESAGNSVKISASGLVTTIDCVSTYTHGFILRGGSLKDMPYEISQS